MGFQCVPYVVALFSAMLWMYYALLKTEVLLISINSLGCIIEAIYVLLYILYASKEARKQAMKVVSMVIVGGFCGILVVTHFGLEDNSIRIKVVGWICVCFSVSVFAAPLSIVLQVVRTGSAEFMPFALSLPLTLSAIMWFCYGLLTKGICVAVMFQNSRLKLKEVLHSTDSMGHMHLNTDHNYNFGIHNNNEQR